MSELMQRRFIIVRRRVRVERDKQRFAWGRRQTNECARWVAAFSGGLSNADVRWAVRRFNSTDGRRAVMDGQFSEYMDVRS